MSEPSWTAQIDQMLAGARDLAKMGATYYKGLIAEGVPYTEAATMSVGFVHSVLTMPKDDDGE